MDKKFHRSDLLPMWVADMDFKSPKPVIDAIIDRANYGIFGYTSRPLHYYKAIIFWIRTGFKYICLANGLSVDN